jgi:hypothetical protein
MSVNGHVILADWPALERRWRDDPKAFEDPEFFWDEQSSPLRSESWDADDWVADWSAACEASCLYDRLRKKLDRGTRDKLDRLLGPFFWEKGAHTPDLPGLIPTEGLSNVLSPHSVDAMVRVAESLDLEGLREPFERHCRPDQGGWVCDFETFRDYIDQWLKMLRVARASGKAVVLWVA